MVAKLLIKGAAWVHREYTFVLLRHTLATIPALPVTPATWSIAEIHPSDIRSIVEKFSLPRNYIDRFTERIRRGDKGYSVCVEGTLAYVTWITQHIMLLKELGLAFQIPECTAALVDSRTLPQFRGRGLHKHMNLYRLHQLKTMNMPFAYVLIMEGNTPAMRVQQKQGGCIILTVGGTRLLGRFAKNRHFRLFESDDPFIKTNRSILDDLSIRESTV